MTQTMEAAVLSESLELVRRAAESAGVFGAVTLRDGALGCEAKESGAPAQFRVYEDAGRLWVALATPDRWLSQSIEQDLVHTGDKLHELMDEELAEQGHRGSCVRFEHYRDESKTFVFRTAIPVAPGATPAQAAETITRFLLACEAMFRPLGDMSGGGEDE